MALHLPANPDLPNLNRQNHWKTSDATRKYNCVAHALHCTSHWWWPSPAAYWPPGAPRLETLQAFQEAMEALGFEICGNPKPQPGYVKIAIFTNDRGEPTHIARLLKNGNWTSKLGPDIDIEHTELRTVSGGTYGQAAMIMRRKVL